jgi:hypothetical protein
MSGFLGMRGTGDWVTDERPKDWRETILFLYPNGSAPLTAILSKMKSEKTDDAEFNWWTKMLPTQRAAITGVWTNTALNSAYTSGGVVGTTLYIQMAEADADQFRIGHQVLLRDASDFSVDVNVKVTAVTKAGAASYLTVKLLEADDNSIAAHDLSDADTAIIIGNINEEGAYMPTAISYDPTKFYNYTQIFRTPLSITRTARETKYRTGDKYKEMKREALEIHSIEMEKALLFGVPTELTGANGKPERTTGGIVTFLRTNNALNVSNYMMESAFAGKEWLEDGGGEDWLEEMLMKIFLYGRQEKFVLCGNGALLGINKLAKAGGHYTLTPQTKSYGIKVTEWVTPYGTLYLKTHPLFNVESTLQYSMLLMEPENLRYRFITDTSFFGEAGKTASQGQQYGRKDATDEEYLTEAGLEMHHGYTFGFLDGVGRNNPL